MTIQDKLRCRLLLCMSTMIFNLVLLSREERLACNSYIMLHNIYTPAKRMFFGVSVCLSVCPSVYKIVVSVKGLAGVLSHI